MGCNVNCCSQDQEEVDFCIDCCHEPTEALLEIRIQYDSTHCDHRESKVRKHSTNSFSTVMGSNADLTNQLIAVKPSTVNLLVEGELIKYKAEKSMLRWGVLTTDAFTYYETREKSENPLCFIPFSMIESAEV